MLTKVLRLKLLPAGLLLIGSTLVIQMIYLFSLGYQLDRLDNEIRMASIPYECVAKASSCLKLFYQANTCLMAYKITGDQAFGGFFAASVKNFKEELDAVSSFMRSSPETISPDTVAATDRLGGQAVEALTTMREMFENRDQFISPVQLKMIQNSAERFVDEFFTKVTGSVIATGEVQQRRLQTESALRHVVKILLVSGFFLSAGLSVASLIFWIGTINSRIEILLEDSRRLGEGKPLLEVKGGFDEIAELELVLHKVADELKETKQIKLEFIEFLNKSLFSHLESIQTTLKIGCAGEFALDQKGRDRFEKALTSTNRLISLIHELLDVHKIETGVFLQTRSNTNVLELLQSAVSEMEALAYSKKVALKVDCEPITASIDAGRIQQVLINLISNAVKYAPEGSIVSISAWKDQNALEVNVRDQGSGIPEEFLGSLFSRYQQAQGSKDGTGLGLFISKAIVTEHGGAIGADNPTGGGALTWFTIPLETSEAFPKAQS